jgi:hypothetical protein
MTRATCPICTECLLSVADACRPQWNRYRCPRCGEYDMEFSFAGTFGARARLAVPPLDLDLLTSGIQRSNREGVVPVVDVGVLGDGHD